jgi:subtilisin
MMRTFVSVFVAVVALLAVPTRSAMQSRSVLPVEIAAQAAEGPVRVIVRLDVAAVPASALHDAGAGQSQRAALAAAQDAALDALPGLADAPRRFLTVPAFAITTDAAGLERLAALPSVVAIEPDRALGPLLLDTPNMIGATSLWSRGTEGHGWSVAVLDTGVDKSHAFYTSRVTSEACYSTNSPALGATSLCPGAASSSTATFSGLNCANTPGCDHGTAVAAVAAGRGTLVSGIARSANLISIQVYSRLSGSGLCGSSTHSPVDPCLRAFSSDVILAMERVLALAGAGNAGRIGAVNLSAGATTRGSLFTTSCDSTDSAFAQAIENLRAVGIPVIIPSGNDGSSSQLAFPACMSRAISVGSVNKAGPISSFSNRSALLHLLAPGESIRTAGLRNPFDDEPYVTISGTSLAAAHVAGGWTLLKSSNPDATVDAVLQGLQLTGVPIGDSSTGLTYRRIWLNAAEGSMGPTGSPTSVNVSAVGTTVTSTWNPPFDGSVPVAYHVEIRSATTGAMLAIVNVGGNRTFFTTLDFGRYLLRVRSITDAGPGAASSDVAFNVGVAPPTVPPLAPRSLRADVNGQSVTLTWNVATDSAPPTSFIVEAGSLPGLTNFGTFETGTFTLATTVNDVQPGTYWVRVRARNAHGVSEPSNEVRIDVTGSGCILPLPPSRLNATVIGSMVTLNWTPPAVVGTITGYVIEVGSAPGLSDIIRTTTSSAATVVSATASAGAYYVRVRAQSTCGLTGPSNEVTVVVP